MKLMYLAALVFFGKQQPVLHIELTGIKQIQGSVMVAVYDTQDSFLGQEAIVWDGFEVKADTLVAKVPLPYGKYAISVFHDVNSDGELNTNIFGIPKEPVGFSKDAKGSFGPPNFDKAAIDFNKDQQIIRITLAKPGI